MDLLVALTELWMFTLAVWGLSYLWKTNPFFTFTSNILISVGIANGMVYTWFSYMSAVAMPLTAGAFYKIIPFIISLLMVSTFFNKWRWVSRYPTAILAGTGLGLVLRSIFWSDVLGQIQASMFTFTGDLALDFSNIFYVVMLVLSLFYFTFGLELKGAWGNLLKYSRLIMMASLGAQFASYLFYAKVGISADMMLAVISYLKGFFVNLF